MRRAATYPRLLLAGLLVTLLTATATVPATADDAAGGGSDATAIPQLHRDGRFLVDQFGRVVVVHGLNLVWKQAPYVPPDTAAGFTEADADWLAAHGFNGARVGMLWAGVTPDEPGVADEGYFEKWDRVLDLLADRGIWIQFDAHQDQWHETYGGEGVPDWAQQRPLPWSLTPVLPVPFPQGYWTPEVSTVFDQFWANKRGLLDAWAASWTLVAERYRDQPYSMGYDLLNEPWAGLEWPLCLLLGCQQTYRKELQPAMEKGLAAVRQVDPDGIVWWEPQQFSGGLPVNTFFEPVAGEDNLGLSWHNYCPAVFLESTTRLPLGATKSCRNFSTGRNEHALRQAATMDAVPLMTEWGATDNVEAVAIDADVADEHQMGWMYWAYKRWEDPTTADSDQGLFVDDADLTSVKEDKLRELVRTYPQATAGIPLAWHYDTATGAFTMHYRNDPEIDAPTRIFVSPLTSPDGYAVVASDGEVTVDGSIVEVRSDLDGVVEVTVTPRS